MEGCNSVLGILSAQINAPPDIQRTYNAVKIREHMLMEKHNRVVDLMVKFFNHVHKSGYK